MAPRAYLVCDAMRIRGILEGRGRVVSFLLITIVVTTIKNCICYPSSLKRTDSNRCTGLQLSGATEVALLLTRPNFNTGKTYNYKGLPFVI